MTTVPPAPLPSPNTAPPAPSVPAAVTARVSAPPPGMTRLPPNTVIEGQVIQAAARGQPAIVRTDLGPLTLRASIPLPQGAQVTLDLLSVSRAGEAILRIATLNGQPVGQPPGAAPPLDPGAGSAGSPTSSPVPSGVRGGAAPGPPPPDGRSLVTATVVRGGAGTPFEAGTLVQARLVGITPPARATPAVPASTGGLSGPGPAAPGAIGGAPASGAGPLVAGGTPGTATPAGAQTAIPGAATPAAPTPLDGGGTSPTAVDQAAAHVRARLSSMVGRVGAALSLTGIGAGGASAPPATRLGAAPVPPHPAPAGSSAAPQAATLGPATAPSQTLLTGTIQAGGTASRTLLATPAGTLALHLRLDTPPGSQVSLSVVTSTPPPTAAASPATGAAAPASPSLPQGGPQGWAALTEVADALSQRDPAAARALQGAIPQPGPQLAAALGRLTAALRAGGDTRQWPGELPMRVLEADGVKGERLAETLRGDLRALAGRMRESPGGEWRAITLPFADGAEITPITLITRLRGGPIRDRGAEETDTPDRNADSGDRFVVDLTLSTLGRLQIDGLIRPQARHLYLILRTAQPLPAAMRQDLMMITETGLTALGLEGGLTFQADGRFVDPVPDAAESAPTAASPKGVIA